MYDELIKRLRECTAEQNGEKTLWHQAADAIEDLDNRLNLHRQGKIGHWIPVTDRLPDHRTTCLIADDGTVVVGWRNLVREWYDVTGDRLKYVTHWMPLPQPPKDGEA